MTLPRMAGAGERAEPTLQRGADGYAPLRAYAAIGDGQVLALVASDGSIDWLCLPQLDSPSVFGAVLDPARGGSFSLAPSVPFESERRYVERTNVLETTFRTADGTVRVTDALCRPAGEAPPGRELVRRVEGLSGRVPLLWRLEPRFDYGRQTARIERLRDDARLLSGERLRLGFQSWDAGEPSSTGGLLQGSFTAEEGTSALLVLRAVPGGPLLLSRREAVERRLDGTVEYWRRWIARNEYRGGWSAAVERSLLAIGLLADERTGAIAAAGTTSLPEAIHGQRNFDYRYAWTRDLSFTLDALLRVGFDDLVHESFNWMLAATSHTHPRVDPVYRLAGPVLRGQTPVPMPGYRLSRPVLRGNQAGSQLQLGGFGDFIDIAYMYVKQGGVLDVETGERIADIADLLTRIWRSPDAGIWELSEEAQYASSKMGVWVAFDRVVRLAEQGDIPARDMSGWRRAREDVLSYVEQRLWSPARRSYVEKEGSEALDASVLLAARRGFADPRGERMNSTIDAVRRELGAGGPLLYRYSGMSEQENAFLACSFWCVDALAMANRHDEAAETMDALVALAGDVGLYPEEMDPVSHAFRGNVPQALTHLALVNAAVLFEESSPGGG